MRQMCAFTLVSGEKLHLRKPPFIGTTLVRHSTREVPKILPNPDQFSEPLSAPVAVPTR